MPATPKSTVPESNVTSSGESPTSFDAMFDVFYEDLRALAQSRLRRDRRATLLDTTALVHESYLRIAAAGKVGADDRPRFLCYAARVMRSVVVDFARARNAQRRGSGAVRISVSDDEQWDRLSQPDEGAVEILRVHEALEELEAHDARSARIVEMRYFGGMSEREAAEALGVTERTIRRYWEKARLLLAEALR